METDNKSMPVVWLKELDLNDEQKDLIAMLINIFITDSEEYQKGHYFLPHANRDNINDFSVSMLKEVLNNPVLIEGKTRQEPKILVILESVEEKLMQY